MIPWFGRRGAYEPAKRPGDSRLEPIEPSDDIDRMVNESLERGRLRRE